MGVSDLTAIMIYYSIITYKGIVTSYTILFFTLAVSSLCLVLILAMKNLEDSEVKIKPLLSFGISISIMAMRISSFATFAINYSTVIELTPTLMVGLVFGIVNTIASFLTVFAPLIAELVYNSSWTVTILAGLGVWVVSGLQLNVKID